MSKTVYNKFDKALISSLPVAQFTGRIIVILTPGETEKAVRYLLTQDILGFDTETRPSFKRGHHNRRISGLGPGKRPASALQGADQEGAGGRNRAGGFEIGRAHV